MANPSIFFRRPEVIDDLTKRANIESNFLPVSKARIRYNSTPDHETPVIKELDITPSKSNLAHKDDKPVLTSLKYSIEGDIGLQQRLTLEFRLNNKEIFEEFDKNFGIPGLDIQVHYGYTTTKSPGDLLSGSTETWGNKEWLKFKIFEPSFEFSPTAMAPFSVIYKLKAMSANVLTTQYNAMAGIKSDDKKKIKGPDGTEVETPVKNLLDALDVHFRDQHNVGSTDPTKIIKEGDVWVSSLHKNSVTTTFTAPSCYEPLYAPVSSADGDNPPATKRLNYVSLGFIVNGLINTLLLEKPAVPLPDVLKDTRFICNDQVTTGVNYQKIMFSTDPMNILFTGYRIQMEYCNRKTTPPLGGPEMSFYQGPWTGFTADGKDIPRVFDNTLNGNIAALANVLISVDFIKAEIAKGETAATPLFGFFNAIFKKIKKASAGAYNLQLLVNPDKDKEILIKNLKESAGAPAQETYKFKVAGDWNVLSIGISSKLPSERAMAAMAGVGQSKGTEDLDDEIPGALKDMNAGDKPTASGTKNIPDWSSITDAMAITLPTGKYDVSAQEAANTVLRSQFSSVLKTIKEKAESMIMTWPLTLTLTVRGIEGFRYGDYITTDFLPLRFQGRTDGLFPAFTITRIEQEIDNASIWKTHLTTIFRMTASSPRTA